MERSNFSITISGNQAPAEVFESILRFRAWWSGYYSEEFSGQAENIGDVFEFKAGEGQHYSKQKLIELIPGKKIAWLVTDSRLSFLEQKDEWTGTKLIFEISPAGNNTQVKFIHEGLTPRSECYDACAPAWTQYIQNKLQSLINQ